ncbi:lantibiotic dehydratase C-terminal domain-containing protein [Enterococcus sp. LJL99]
MLLKEYLQQLREKISLDQEEDYGVLFSHIHMFNNRIEVPPEYEYHLSSLLYRELEEEL